MHNFKWGWIYEHCSYSNRHFSFWEAGLWDSYITVNSVEKKCGNTKAANIYIYILGPREKEMVGKGQQWRLGRLFQRTWGIFVWRGRSSVLQAHCCQLRHVERNSSDKRADKNMDAALRGLPSRGLGNTRKHMDCGGKIVRFREGWKEGTGHCQGASNSVFSSDLPDSKTFLPILVNLFLGRQESQRFISSNFRNAIWAWSPSWRSEFQGC